MPLDLGAVGAQVRRLGEAARAGGDDLARRVEAATALLDELDEKTELVAYRAETRVTAWPAALPVEPIATRRRVAPAEPDYVAVASDGSHLDVEHHRPVACYLINLGLATIRYGGSPSAELRCSSSLGFTSEDLYLVHGGRQLAVEGHLLNIKRQYAEVAALAEAAEAERDDRRGVVALIDGTLILSSPEARGRGESDPFLRGYLGALARLRAAGALVASYISRPRHRELVGALRLGCCPLAECDDDCGVNRRDLERRCSALAGVWDRAAMARLAPGERSGVWTNAWPLSRRSYGEHAAHFFYLHTGDEIARVEVPEWLAGEPASLDRLHAILLDQCRRGEGYPRVLNEAHQQAVITAADRRAFEELVERELARLGVLSLASPKERSKRRRTL